MSKILLNPGPTNTSFHTKLAQWRGSDICHRTEEFFSLIKDVEFMLLRRFTDRANPEDWNVSILGGTGTTALEAMITSLISDRTQVINAGVYGKRAIDIMNVYNINHDEILSKHIYDLEGSDFYGNLYFVENETSTGENYIISEIIAKYPNARLFIDSTSAFGASNYSNVIDNIWALSFCSNKCLQSTPGLGIVIWRKELKSLSRTYCMDLQRYSDGNLPFTLPTQSLYALEEALTTHTKDYIFQGVTTRHVFNRRAKRLLHEMEEMGVEVISVCPANSIIAFKHPTKNYEQLKAFLLKRNIVVYSGVEGVENSFRISTMSILFDKKFKKIVKAFYDSCIY